LKNEIAFLVNHYFFLLKRINPEKLIDVQKKLESFLAQDQDLKERAQRVSHF
jgi:hypothetical protein